MNSLYNTRRLHKGVNEWDMDFSRLGDELKQTTQDSEEEFMLIGSRLQEFFTTTERIAQMASTITHFLSGSNITETIEKLRELITQMNEYIQYSEIETSQRVTELTHLLGTITSLYAPIEEIKRNIKRLNTLGFATRIHSGTSHGTNILADDIEKLSSEIVMKKTLILESLKSLAATIQETLAHISGMNERHLHNAWVIVDNTMSSLTALTDKRTQSTNIGKSISIFSERAFKSVEEVVKSLQFHDIIYQKMAHMKDMLYDLDKKIEHIKQERGFQGDDTIQHISDIEIMCLDRAKQISEFRDTLTAAVTQIIENLSIVNSNIRTVSDDVFELVGKGKSDQSFLSDIDQSLTSINDAATALSTSADHSLGLSRTIHSFSETLKEISTFLDTIGRIEDDIELIALNASVKAANRGKGGEALGVIAESIRILLADIRKETAVISESLKSIISVIENLSARVTKESTRDTEVYSRTEVLKSMVDNLYRMNSEFASSLAGIDTDSTALSKAIEETIEGIHTHAVVAEVCNKTIIELETMGSSARTLIAGGSPGAGMSLKHRASKEEELGPVEVRDETIQINKGNGTRDEFGDNVELF